jgi:Kef-type K+ transport system membrane component KefB
MFPAPVLATINGLAVIGVLLFVFVSGLHLDSAQLRDGMRRLAGPMVGSVGLPLLLGLGSGVLIVKFVPSSMGPRGGVITTAAAIAICIAVTALPVLAAILRELGLINSWLGQTALGLAAMNDAALWIMLAALVALSHGSIMSVILIICLSVFWPAVMLGIVRPLLAWVAARGANEGTMLVASLSVAFASKA